MSPRVERAVEAIRNLYAVCPAGGPLHIVVDDGNIETHHIDWCIEHVEEFAQSPTEKELALTAAAALLPLSLTQRVKAVKRGREAGK